jgi:hypothetical protein
LALPCTWSHSLSSAFPSSDFDPSLLVPFHLPILPPCSLNEERRNAPLAPLDPGSRLSSTLRLGVSPGRVGGRSGPLLSTDNLTRRARIRIPSSCHRHHHLTGSFKS